MMIIISNMRRPGQIYDTSKYAILMNKITGSIAARTNNKYIAKGKISGKQMQITILQLNPETQKYSPAKKNEQEILVGRISNFLNENGITHDIRVR